MSVVTFIRRHRRLSLAGLASMGAASLVAAGGSGALGSTVNTATFSGGSGTFAQGSTLFAKQGADLTLTAQTSADTQCVEVSGAQSALQTSDKNPKSQWVFHFTAGSGDGVNTVTVAASPSVNSQGKCTGQTRTLAASYVLDNTGPQVAAATSPAANGAGWNNSKVDLNWTATDNGSGVASGPTPGTDSVDADTAGVTKTATATDKLGNPGAGSFTVKLDRSAPTLTTSRSPQPNGDGWNNGDVTVGITCSDGLSGIQSCTGGGTKVVSTEGANQSVTAQAVDNADNTASTTVGPINIDKTAPTLTGDIADGTIGDDGWYRSDVTIHWTADDGLSGVAGVPSDSTITGEGEGLKTSASVADKAGNHTTADSPTVKIDKTAPNTDASAVDAWNNVDVVVNLIPHDSLSGVAATHYSVDGGPEQTGTRISISAEGKHELEYWSVDHAGNAEKHTTVGVNIDKTAPTITHDFSKLAHNGWFNDDVKVTFACDDSLSGIATCGPERVVSAEGGDQDAGGQAVDNAGNTATDPVRVSLDRTPPTITASADRAANADGWYDRDVTVGFTCDDDLSGVAECPAPQTVGEGGDQSATETAVDTAGNSADYAVYGINVDKTAPRLTGETTTEPNENGWYRDDVTVAWTAGDGLSGLAGETPADSIVKGEGSNLSATASVQDRAGNVTPATVGDIRIDRTAPTTTVAVADPLASGWYAGAVTVRLTAADSLSGVDHTYYTVDGGARQDYDGAFDFSQKGEHTITFWSVDKAGNVEDPHAAGHSVTVKIDGNAPAIEGRRTPPANDFGWNNSPVTVSFACEDAESGIAKCSDPVTLSQEGAGQSVNGDAQDIAGNPATTKVDGINIDLTAPTLTGGATTDPNAAGWYKGDVTVHWTAKDALSGINDDTVPADSVIDGEGADLGTGPVSVADTAGNSTSTALNGIKVDRTAPAVTGAPKTQPNAAGWYNHDVVVGFDCTDNLSGVASCPSDKLVSGNGADQSVTSDPAVDTAGNQSDGARVGGLNIDGLAPQTTADNQCNRGNEWCTDSSATVVLKATDQAGLSGVKEIHYAVNGGAEQVIAGDSAGVEVPLTGSGAASVKFFAVDNAGNRESDNGVSLRYDNIAPMVTHTLSPPANADGWNTAGVKVHFDAKDNDGGSGVDPNRTTTDVTVADETAGRTVDGEAYDLAGNRGADSVKVKLDKTAPTITGAVVSGQRGSGSWYTGPVKVHFTCSDGLSGVAVCPDDVTLTANGAGQSVSGKAIDHAGNAATAKVSGIDIDQEKPTITAVRGVANGKTYTLGAVPAATCSATDGVSGVRSCTVTADGGKANGVGTFRYTATATDNAGNTTTQTGSYRVIYRFDGFLQPINDTAHCIGLLTSIFKGGSTVPVKIQLKRADGSVVAAVDAPVWDGAVTGGLMTAPADKWVSGGQADTAGTFRWDSSDKQYQYNWGAAKSGLGYYHRISVTLDDGQTYSVDIGLR